MWRAGNCRAGAARAKVTQAMQHSVKTPELSNGYGTPGAVTRSGGRGTLVIIMAGAFGLGAIGLLGPYWLQLRRAGHAEAPSAGPKPPETTQPAAAAVPRAETDAFLDGDTKLTFDGKTIATTWRALGMEADPDGAAGARMPI